MPDSIEWVAFLQSKYSFSRYNDELLEKIACSLLVDVGQSMTRKKVMFWFCSFHGFGSSNTTGFVSQSITPMRRMQLM